MRLLKNNNFYDPQNLNLVHHVNQSLKANFLFQKDKDYIVKDGSVQIIDEFTGIYHDFLSHLAVHPKIS